MQLGRFGTTLFVAPALLLLGLLFVAPITSFLWNILQETGSLEAALAEASGLLGSPAVLGVMLDTNLLALCVTLIALVIGYPIAYALTRLRGLAVAVLLAAIILPHFTSVIVRTYAWMVLLGRNGVLNQVLLAIGVIEKPLDLLYNRVGVIVGMTYVLLPFMVLTLFAAMKAIDPRLMQAARGMGAGAIFAFRQVFLPLSWHGVIAGSLIVFILSLGFFVTPALMGGPRDLTIAMLIEREIELTMNWPAAAILSLALLAATLLLYAVYSRFADIGRMLG